MVHHYLDVGQMPFSTAYVAFVNNEPVAHLGMTTMHVGKGELCARACRLVVLPEWQGAGVGMRFLNLMAQREVDGLGWAKRPVRVIFHTAHPGLVKSLERDPHWRLLSARVAGNRAGKMKISDTESKDFLGGHWRPVSGWVYDGTVDNV